MFWKKSKLKRLEEEKQEWLAALAHSIEQADRHDTVLRWTDSKKAKKLFAESAEAIKRNLTRITDKIAELDEAIKQEEK